MDLLDVVLHYDCNLHCAYCTLTEEMRARAGVDTKAVAVEIERAARTGCTSISLTGGEPTVRPDLVPLMRFAAKRGFDDIKVQTNGLVFASADNLRRAVDAGLSRVGVSVHTYDPGTDAYARETGGDASTEALMLAAIDNLVASPVALTVDLIVMRSTLGSVPLALRSLHERGVTAFNLWFVSLTDGNAENVESMPRLTDAVPVMRACMDYGREHGVEVASLHVPRCLLPGYEEHVRHPGVGESVRVVTPESVFELSASRLSGGVKPGLCSGCRYDAVCPGLRADYVERFGTDELRPVGD